MTEKLTPEEIKKALECCTQQHKCNGCPYLMEHHLLCNHHLHKDTLDLINHQQAEIERLQNNLEISRKETKRYATRRAEAIKEFAERLKEHLKGNGGLYCVTTMNAQIDNLVKEMVGGNNE